MGQFCIEQLANGDIVYPDYQAPGYATPAFSYLVFLHPDGTSDALEIPANYGGPSAIARTGAANRLWLLTSTHILEIDTRLRFILSATEVDGAMTASGWPTNMTYASTQNLLCWHHGGEIDGLPFLVTFNPDTRKQVSKDPYPPGRGSAPGDAISEWFFKIGYLDGQLWASFARNDPGVGVPVYYVYRIVPDSDVSYLTVSYGSGTGGPIFQLDEQWQVDDPDGTVTTFTVLQVLSPTRVLVNADKLLPSSYYTTAVNEWFVLRKTITGLWHLEGQEVDILADGAVHPRRTVVGGTITLDYAARIITIGIRITADLRTLPLSMEGAQAAGQGTMKNINKVHLRVSQSSLVKAGPSLDRLREYPARAVSDPYGRPPALRDGELSLTVDPTWNNDAVICVRQDVPVPLTVVSMTLEIQSGG